MGWERAGRELGPQRVNLAASMDPRQLVRASVELNLQLMRWRQEPSLDLRAVADARCLLFGAGTLGVLICEWHLKTL